MYLYRSHSFTGNNDIVIARRYRSVRDEERYYTTIQRSVAKLSAIPFIMMCQIIYREKLMNKYTHSTKQGFFCLKLVITTL